MYIFATFSGEGIYRIRKGERIAQMLLLRSPTVCVEVIGSNGDTGIAARGKLRLFPKDDGMILAKQCIRISTWIKCLAIPAGYFGRIIAATQVALSGMFVVNGVIDSDYRGEVDIILHNLSDNAFYFTKHTKIAMLHVQPCAHIDFVGEKSAPLRTGGFGSTGK